MPGLRRISGFLIGAFWLSAVAAAPLQRAQLVSSDDHWTTYELVFDEDVRLIGEVQRRDDRLVVQLQTNYDGPPSYEAETLDYEGALGPIIDVTVAGYAAHGLTLTIAMTETTGVELLPQTNSRRVALRVPVVAPAIAPAAVAEPPAVAKRAALAAPAAVTTPATIATIPKVQVPPVIAPAAVEARPQRGPDPEIALPEAAAAVMPVGDAAATEALATGRAAAANGEYANAIAAFTKALTSADVAVRKEAMELLGVAREYNNQKAQAKAVWDQYLVEFPDGQDAARVRQRIAGLITRDLPSQSKLKPQQTPSPWNIVGNLSQFYRRYALDIQGQDEVVGIDAFFTDADVIVERRGDNLDLGARISGGHIYDMTGDLDDGRVFAISTAYLESEFHPWDLNLRVGRQSRSSAGILGRFDGMLLAWAPVNWLNVGVVSGYAVDSSFDGFHPDRPFYGVSVETTSADGKLAFAPFIIEQQVDGFTDRRAVGMEARYYRDNGTIFSLVDYDIYHEELNNVYVFGNFLLTPDIRIYASYDYRRSPYISTQNALIGQPYDDLSDLERQFASRDILKLANDRTAEVSYLSTGADFEISERYQVGFDFAASDFSETPSSGDVPGFPGRKDFYYSLRGRANELFGAGSFTSLTLRYTDSEDSTTRSAYLTNRFRIAESWFLYPRIRGDIREYLNTDQQQWSVAPSLRLDYRWARTATFEFESGYEWTTRKLPIDEFKINGYFLRAGYRWLF